jgi:glycosyltransferase involved in cell wall biosynthesis
VDPLRVLHILTQRPGHTGSGVTLEALVRAASARGWEQRVAAGTPSDDPAPRVGDLAQDAVEPLAFAARAGDPRAALPFPVPGMSDVMPYASSRFSALSSAELELYRTHWRAHLERIVARFRPHVIHAHHAWIVGALLRDVAPATPIVLHGHGTELRQLELCPALAPEVIEGCRRADRFALLHAEHARRYGEVYRLRPEQVAIVGASYRQDLFHARGRAADAGASLVFAGKLSRAKGLPWLLDALEQLAPRWPGLRLSVAGGGAGPESDALRERMRALAPLVEVHGELSQAELGALLRRSAVFVLPSFSEGLPLVLVEAAACGCRLVATRLPGIESGLTEPLDGTLELVEPPRMLRADEPDPRDLPGFTNAFAAALDRALRRGPLTADVPADLEPFAWDAVFGRVESLWLELARAS